MSGQCISISIWLTPLPLNCLRSLWMAPRWLVLRSNRMLKTIFSNAFILFNCSSHTADVFGMRYFLISILLLLAVVLKTDGSKNLQKITEILFCKNMSESSKKLRNSISIFSYFNSIVEGNFNGSKNLQESSINFV